MLERAALLVLIALGVAAIVLVVRAIWTGRLARLRVDSPSRFWSALGQRPDGRPALVVFSSAGCAACRTAQEPAVEAVASRLGGALRIMQVDIASQPQVGRVFGVMTAPSTVVLNAEGGVGSVNQGFAPAERLAGQLSAAGVSPASPGSPSPPAQPAPGAPAPADRR
jgi:hypothetical protein